MLISGLDIETTGLKYEDGHRIIEVCVSVYDFETREHKGYFEQRIDPQRSIFADAQRVHGISLDMLAGKPVFKDVAPKLVKLLQLSDIVVGHNGMNFDFPFIAWELMQNGFQMPTFEPFDTLHARWATWNGKQPKLEELCFALGIEYDHSKAHAARYDVDVMMEAFFAARDRGYFQLEWEKAA